MPAKFIVFEGIDGCGKSTVLSGVAERLRQQGYRVLTAREPGSTPLAEQIRNLIKTVPSKSKGAELFLQEAARRDLVDTVLKPNYDRYDYILFDRYIYSTITYQGYGNGSDLALIDRLNDAAIDGYYPHLGILIDVKPETAAKRRQLRSNSADKFDQHFNHADAYAERVYQAYQMLAGKDHNHRINVNKTLVSVNNDDDTTIAQTIDRCLTLIHKL